VIGPAASRSEPQGYDVAGVVGACEYRRLCASERGHTRETSAQIAELLSDTEVEFNDEFAGNNHIMGTTIMGADPRSSVVDADFRTDQHPNLYIAGTSVFATSGSINATLTLAALALGLAHHLADSSLSLRPVSEPEGVEEGERTILHARIRAVDLGLPRRGIAVIVIGIGTCGHIIRASEA
jgi:hypothetical protein